MSKCSITNIIYALKLHSNKVIFISQCYFISRVIILLGLIFPTVIFLKLPYLPGKIANIPLIKNNNPFMQLYENYRKDQLWRWADSEAELLITSCGEITLKINNVIPSLVIKIFRNGFDYKEIVLNRGINIVKLNPLSDSKRTLFSFKSSESFIPSESYNSNDNRRLSFQLFEIKCHEDNLLGIESSDCFKKGFYDVEGYKSPFGNDGLLNYIYRNIFQWDAAWYLRIVENGYSYSNSNPKKDSVAFFPLYSMTAWIFSRVTMCSVRISMFVLSNIFSISALFVIYMLAELMIDERYARLTVLLLCFFPSSLFLFLPYSEGLFLLLFSLFLYSIIKEEYWLASILAGLSSATRSAGVVLSLTLVTYLLWNYFIKLKNKKYIRTFLIQSILSMHGLIVFIVYLWSKFNEPFAFVKAIKRDGVSNLSFFDAIISLIRHLFVMIEFLSSNSLYLIYSIYLINVMLFLLGLIVSIYLITKKEYLHASIGFLLIMFASVPMSGFNLSSFNRYFLVNIPILMGISKIMCKSYMLSLSVLVLCLITMFIMSFYWGVGIFVA